MSATSLLRRASANSPAISAACTGARTLYPTYYERRSHYATATDALTGGENGNKKDKWFTLPPFASTIDGSAIGKDISRRRSGNRGESPTSTTTALKWVTRCCPQLPRSLVQKLFRLRQVTCCSCWTFTNKCVRREFAVTATDLAQVQERKVRRVAAKDSMELGDRIFLPITVQASPSEKAECVCNEEELKFLYSLELYKDPAIIVVNKPPGMPVQGGIGIKRSLDELAGVYLRDEYSEPPRLVSSCVFLPYADSKHVYQSLTRKVHRLDRDSSGILVMGRTQLSATVLHSIFREKTAEASGDDLDRKQRVLQRRYWALVIGSPRRPEGLISVPLGKVVMDNGTSERITVVDNVQTSSSQLAITKYRVITSSSHGFTWLELSPLTGRKHQLRVHCAEVLGTPIVGDYKYGWQAHRKWKQMPFSDLKDLKEKLPKGKTSPFDLDLEGGSISEKHPHLHLHCKEMVLPDVSMALQRAQSSSDCDLAELESLKLVAPLPSHMQRSWDTLNT
ncbi:hypothetical protein RJ640_018705 [Escallonia rubra]|uniref:Pseudouridine synthase RsuA/RluA-like domain-containing protein n=1 Tax=Escallonia rubra TaxID=112253 RepID=A0AA88RHT9_9ASTE|nr:hypothetical protein RJ640_018705 [Escallonia rubra]